MRKYGKEGKQGKYLQKPAKDNVGAFRSKVAGIIKGNKTAKQENIIALLNPIIRGWSNYHQHVTDRQYGATDVRRNGAISKCLKWGLERC